MHAFLPDKSNKMRCVSFSMSVQQRSSQEMSLDKSKKDCYPRAACFSPLLALPEGMSTGTWHLFQPVYWAIRQGRAFLSQAENSGISIAHSPPEFSLDSLKENIMWWSPVPLANWLAAFLFLFTWRSSMLVLVKPCFLTYRNCQINMQVYPLINVPSFSFL